MELGHTAALTRGATLFFFLFVGAFFGLLGFVFFFASLFFQVQYLENLG
jgi:hypothetical protein